MDFVSVPVWHPRVLPTVAVPAACPQYGGHIPSTVDGELSRDQHVRMGDDDEYDDEPVVDDDELSTFEKQLFAAIRESQKLDAEIDDEYRRLTSGEYPHPGPTEGPP